MVNFYNSKAAKDQQKYIKGFNTFADLFMEGFNKFKAYTSDKRTKMQYFYNNVCHFEKLCTLEMRKISENLVQDGANPNIDYESFGNRFFNCVAIVYNYPTELNNFKNAALSNLIQIMKGHINQEITSNIRDKLKVRAIRKGENKNELIDFFLNILVFINNSQHFNIAKAEINVYSRLFASLKALPGLSNSALSINNITISYLESEEYADFVVEQLASYTLFNTYAFVKNHNKSFDDYLNEQIDTIPSEKIGYLNVLKIGNLIENENNKKDDSEVELWDITLSTNVANTQELFELASNNFKVILGVIANKSKLGKTSHEMLSVGQIKHEWMPIVLRKSKPTQSENGNVQDNGQVLNVNGYNMTHHRKSVNNKMDIDQENDNSNEDADLAERKKYNQKGGPKNIGTKNNTHRTSIDVDSQNNKISNPDQSNKNIIILGQEQLTQQQIDFIEKPNLRERIYRDELPSDFQRVIYVQVVGSSSDCMAELIKNGIIARNSL